MSIAQLAEASATALGEDFVRELLDAALGLARGDVRDVTLELPADQKPMLIARRITRGSKLPKRT